MRATLTTVAAVCAALLVARTTPPSDRALAALRNALRARPGDPETVEALASVLEHRLGRRDEAREVRRTALTVAARGPGSNRESSPNICPGPSTAIRFSRPSGA